MSSRICKSYDAKLKARVAIEALKGVNILELCKENKVPKSNVIEWRNKLTSEAESLYISSIEKKKAEKLLKQEIEKLHKIIGEITIENNFLKKKLMR